MCEDRTPNPVFSGDIDPKEGPSGIFRRTLTYSPDAMLCLFDMKKGAKIPLHNHKALQVGYVISGRIRFFTGESGSGGFEVASGGSYLFDSEEPHGAEVLEDSTVIEVFVPCRPEYKP